MRRKWQGWVALAVGATMLGGGALSASAHDSQTVSTSNPAALAGSAQSSISRLAHALAIDSETPVAPGTIDDGKELLPQATISLEEAVAAAQGAASGAVGEVDLEHYQDRLVFNVDVGNHDVKVDAADGTILGSVADD